MGNMVTPSTAVIGRRVKSIVNFVDVPIGTQGVITEDYGSGIMIDWDLPNRESPLRDGFSKVHDLRFLVFAD